MASADTRYATAGSQPATSFPVAVLNIARCLRGWPLTVVKSPPMTTHLPSGLVAIAQTAPSSVGANLVGTPLVRLNAAR